MRFSRSSVVSRSEKGGCEDLGENTVGVRLPEARPHPVPPHEHESRREPPHPDPLLHKCVEEREMERRARTRGFTSCRISVRPLPFVQERVLFALARRQDREWTGAAVGYAGGWIKAFPSESNQIRPDQTCGEEGGSGQWLVAKLDAGIQARSIGPRRRSALPKSQTQSNQYQDNGNRS